MTVHVDPATAALRPLIIDSFAGGGGASEGIRAALGRDPDYALNHDGKALAMHRINHPATKHIEEDVWNVDAIGLCAGRKVGLVWMSPDCRDFSKAKGGVPRQKNIRGLAWVGVRWVKSLPKWQRPDVVVLENVEEFQKWGPLLKNGHPCPIHRGSTFRQYVKAWQALGAEVQYRELRACDYGVPTIRKRLFMVIRFDGEPIVWPEPTHGDPRSEAVLSGRLKPWRAAAEVIDWTLPCPSIFETKAEIWEKHRLRVQRPLKPNSMARLATGTMRYVVRSARPYLVQVNHGGATGGRMHDIDAPHPTLTGKRGEALVQPFITHAQQGGRNRDVADPLHTICASPNDQNAIVAPFLAPRYQEKPGHGPRVRSVEAPSATIIGGDNVPGHLAAVHLTRQFGGSVGSDAADPVGTITAGGAGKAGLVAAFLAQHNTARGGRVNPGNDARSPVSTITAAGGNQNVVAAHLMNMHGSDRRDAPADAPLQTITSGGNHAAAVYAFLSAYYGTELDGQPVDEPIGTVTTKPRHGVVTVMVEGQPFYITDIGMRMLTTRERFSAQGFRDDYVIDRGELEDGTVIKLTQEEQGSMCGNSVCPGLAEAIIRSVYRERPIVERAAPADLPLFAAE